MEISRTVSAKRGMLGRALVGVLGLGGLVGCSGTGSMFDPDKGFLDPTAVGRYQKEDLVVPILSSIDQNRADVANVQFRGATDVRPEDLNPANTDYAIGRNDLLSISITDLVAPNVETNRVIRVSESGMISLPLVGQVKAIGLTEALLEQAISKAYRDASLIQNAQVSVSVAEARARTFSILGTVQAPGQYAILNSEFSVFDALVLARGVSTPQGIDYIYVIRKTNRDQAQKQDATQPAAPAKPGEDVLTPQGAADVMHPVMAQVSPSTAAAQPMSDDDQKFITVDGKQVKVTAEGQAPAAAATPAGVPAAAATSPAAPAMAAAPTTEPFEFKDPVAEGTTRVIRIPYDALKNGDLRYNIVIKPYDMIVVPDPTVGEYYMGGHVGRVGVYSLSARKITLKQAVISSGMFDQIAVPARTEIIRRVGGEKEIFAAVDLDKVFAGEQPDIFLKPDDVVNVGTSWWAPFAAAIRNGFRATYGFGTFYDRNFGDYDDPFGMAGEPDSPNFN